LIERVNRSLGKGVATRCSVRLTAFRIVSETGDFIFERAGGVAGGG
jgi:hypothetical protein